MAVDRGTFGRLGFIVAAVGSAIGLGNIWKFPYITYANEGGSFVLVYLAAIVLIGPAIMIAEVLVGRRTQQSPVGAFLALAPEVRGGRAWTFVGSLGVFTGFVLLSYYAVIAGWTVFYFGKCLVWSIRGFDLLDAGALSGYFGGFLADGTLQLTFFAVFILITVGVVAFGIRSGIERVTKTLMPALAAILLLLVVNSVFSPGFGEALRFLFHVGPITADGFLEAVGHAFFTLSLGMGAMITYGSYMGRKQSIPRAAAAVCIADTVIALMACVVMFTIIFGVPDAERATTFSKSATILFTTLPRMFYSVPLGALLAPLFYILVSFAALTSTISLLEVVVSYFIDRRRWSRMRSCLVVGVAVFLMGVPAALSLGASPTLSAWTPLGDLSEGVFDTFDYLVSNWFLPVGGLLMSIYAGWFLKARLSRPEIEEGHGRFALFPLWQFLLRFVCPVAILWILWAVIGGRSFA